MKKKILVVSYFDVNNESLNGVTKIGYNIIKYNSNSVELLILPFIKPNMVISLIKYCFFGVGVFNDYIYREQLLNCIKLVEKKENEFDVIHFLGPQFLFLDSILSKQLIAKSIVQPIDNLLVFKGRLFGRVGFLKKVFYSIELCKLKKLYSRLSRFNNLIFVSRRDSGLFNRFSMKKSRAIENGVNLNYKKKSDFKLDKLEAEQVKLVFHGDLTYQPNTEAIYFLHELKRELGHKFKIDVIGKYNEQLKLECYELNFLGFVDDLSEKLTKYDLYLCPIFSGAGIKNKLLEASYMKIPVISTREATIGTSLKAGVDYVNAETISDFVSEISNLSTNEVLRRSLAQNASLKIENSFSWNKVIKCYEEEYNKVCINNNSKD